MKKILGLLTLIIFSLSFYACGINQEPYWQDFHFSKEDQTEKITESDSTFIGPKSKLDGTFSYYTPDKNIIVQDNKFIVKGIVPKNHIVYIETTLHVKKFNFQRTFEFVLKKTPTYKLVLPDGVSINDLDKIEHLYDDDTKAYQFRLEQAITLNFKKIPTDQIKINNQDISLKDKTYELIPNKDNPTKEYVIDIAKINLTIDYNGVTINGKTQDVRTVYKNHIINENDLPKLTKQGSIHTGWFEASGKVQFPYLLDSDKTLTAQFDEMIKFKLTYDLDGGELTNKKEYFNQGETYILPTPFKAKHRFIGWVDEDNFPITEITFNGHRNIIAKYEKLYNLTANLNDSEVNLKTQFVKGEEYILPIPTKTGHKFVGWQLTGTSEYKTKLIFDRDYYISAIFVEEITLTLNHDGGVIDDETETIIKLGKGETYKFSKIPFKTKSTFSYYEDSKGNKYYKNQEYTFNENITLNAKYVEGVDLEVYGTNIKLNFIKGQTIKKADLPRPTLDNQHRFIDYYLNEELTSPLANQFVINNDMVIYPKIEEIKVKVKIILPSGVSLNGQTNLVEYEQLIHTDLANPGDAINQEGKINIGYTYLNGHELIKFPIKDLDQDIEITPFFGNVHKVSFDLDGGKTPNHENNFELDVLSGHNLDAISPTKDGYNFKHFINQDNQVFDFNTPINIDYQLKAVYKKLYKVSFIYDGGSYNGHTIYNAEYEEDFEIQAFAPTKVGHEFKHFVNPNNDVITFPYKVSKNDTLRAVWEILSYQLSYDYDGGTDEEGNTSKASETLKYDTPINDPGNLTKAGYKFIGWFVDDNKVSFPYRIKGNTNLKAKFIETITVHYDLNGGTINNQGSLPSKQFGKGEVIQSPGTPIKTGLIFSHWSADGKKITFPYTLPLDKNDITIKAEFTENQGLDPNIPQGYYDSIEGKEGEELVLGLKKILERMNAISYADVRYALEKTDEDPDKKGYVLGMYDRKYYPNKWTGGDPWNREHVWPNSKLGVGRVKAGEKNQASDLHNLRACEKNINSKRNNHHYVNDPSGGPTGHFYNGKWYPGDADQGDAARILLYMAVRYYGILSLKVRPKDQPTYAPAGAEMGDISAFKKFFESDPVDKFEIHRNNEIYKIQKNRNPFIDRADLFYKVLKFFLEKENLTLSVKESNMFTLAFYHMVLTQFVEIKQF